MRQVRLYDTTLRDGLGTPGLSLSVEERLKVAQALDRLGVHFIEAGFPSSNPKEAEFFARLAELELDQATVCAFGMTRRRDTRAEDDEALAVLVGTFADVVCLVGKSWGLHLEKVIKASPEENLAMVADSVAFCHGAGKRVVYDAEHFFDGYRDDPGYALECVRAAAEAGAENVTLCDTNGGSLPGLDPAGAAAEDGLRGRLGRAAGEPLAHLALRGRALQHAAGSLAGLRRLARLHPQGGDARGGGRGGPAHLRARRPGPGRQPEREHPVGALRQGDDPRPGQAARCRDGRRRDGARGRAAQGARAPRLPLRGGAGLLRAAAAARRRRVRAALQAGELSGHHLEKGHRRGRDRGDDPGPRRR